MTFKIIVHIRSRDDATRTLWRLGIFFTQGIQIRLKVKTIGQIRDKVLVKFYGFQIFGIC